MDELVLVNRLREGVPEPADLSIAEARFRAGLHEEPARVRTVLTRRRLITAGALTASAVVGPTIVQSIDFGSGPGPIASAQELADRASAALTAAPAPQPRPDQWYYIRKRGTFNGRPGVQTDAQGLITQEVWIRADGGGLALAPAIGSSSRSHGYVEYRGPDAGRPGVPEGVGLQGFMPWRDAAGRPVRARELVLMPVTKFDRLPTDPRELVRLASRPGDGPLPEKPPSEDFLREQRKLNAFEFFHGLLDSRVLPKQVQVAVYRALALLPNVTARTVKDVLGRPGIAFTLRAFDATQYLILDRTSYRYLGYEHVDAKGRRVSASARVAEGIVDKAGQRP